MKLAIITGGSRGLGLGLCNVLAGSGFELLEFSRSAPHPFSVRIDLANPIESREIISAAIQPLAGEDIAELLVFNNAGTLSPMGTVVSQAPEDVVANLQVNLTSAVAGLAAIVSTFQSSHCRKVITNISSGAAHRAYAGWSLYCAAKAGMEHFIRALAVEQSREAWPLIPINVIPGVIDTEMQAAIRAASPEDFPDVERFVRRKEEGELARPDEVAARIVRIVSSDIKGGGSYNVADYGS